MKCSKSDQTNRQRGAALLEQLITLLAISLLVTVALTLVSDRIQETYRSTAGTLQHIGGGTTGLGDPTKEEIPPDAGG